jgi:hypothetical protein
MPLIVVAGVCATAIAPATVSSDSIAANLYLQRLRGPLVLVSREATNESNIVMAPYLFSMHTSPITQGHFSHHRKAQSGFRGYP